MFNERRPRGSFLIFATTGKGCMTRRVADLRWLRKCVCRSRAIAIEARR